MVLLLPNNQMGIMRKNPTTVLDLTGAVAAHFDANTESSLTLNNQAGFQSVSQFNDLTTNARHLSQATAANQPRLVRGLGNMLSYTQEFSNTTGWSVVGSSYTLDSATHFAPNGSATAHLYTSNGNGSGFFISNSRPALAPATPYTVSFYVRPISINSFSFLIDESNGGGSDGQRYQLTYNVSTGIATGSRPNNTNNGSIISATVDASAGNGWVRVSLAFISSSTNTPALTIFLPRFTSAGQFAVWGGMINLGATANEYIGRNALATDGVDDRMFTNSFVVPQPFSRFSVVTRRNNAAIAQQVLGSRLGVPNIALFHETSTGISSFAGVKLNSSQLFINGQTYQFGELYNGASSSFMNNGNITTGNAGTDGMDGLNIGSFNASAAFSQNDIHAVLILNRLPTTTERQKLEVYLSRRYSWRSLAQGNPYRYHDVRLVY
jgi:hypothetical protein